MAGLLFVAGVTELQGMVKKVITESLHIVRTVFFRFGTSLAFFGARRRATYTVARATRGIDTVAAIRGVGNGMFPDLPGDGGGRLVEPVRNVAEGEALPQESLDTDTVIHGRVFWWFFLHKYILSISKISLRGQHYWKGKKKEKQEEDQQRQYLSEGSAKSRLQASPRRQGLDMADPLPGVVTKLI